ncbi:PREDICTED: nuclease EXOG, mitochondrial-like [Priapulus caudatus]|uniref:Nuclease EXOG, mitochondrial-like n=1 Tax=Priapulus caudatus TaxID=37621 RepID=A0ABM1E393_PRICU|nr:PREDICTED: nuclease EXOG, mitochondrial-like [Priapulus caudatus]XP_014666664.1 PREDICTED: nuclease EXOG, mitochondrial-like [Priapulus caudatus]XP_014666672.1 PREDICTED: nuclease EXOG, mitochondrial-like [Priapulus caudatus]XP_014666679.1 PREDICTED: nuclease EXOG, mitochondrial-like [Priapulus caudatus]
MAMFRGVLIGSSSTALLCTLGFYTYSHSIQQAATTRPASSPLDLQGTSYHVTSDEQAVRQRGSEILKYGIPDRGPMVSYYANHVLSYDQAKRTPLWVAEHIQPHHVKGSADRKRTNFNPDPAVPTMFSATNDDYRKSGWSRGHMAPAADNKHDQIAMEETFYLTNILPQDMDNNSGFWNRLELYCRDLTKRFTDVRIISGPLWLPREQNGKNMVTYQVLGKNNVAVPTHLFKVILVEGASGGSHQALSAFVVPNEPISKHQQLKDFLVPLEHLEKVVGFRFHPQLNRALLNNLCKVDECRLASADDLELYYIRKNLGAASSTKQLDSVWKELERKKLKPDKQLMDMYNKKRQQLLQNAERKSEL